MTTLCNVADTTFRTESKLIVVTLRVGRRQYFPENENSGPPTVRAQA